METDLRSALEREEFRLHYQCILSLESDGITGFEALLRWQHPKRGLIAADQFIPIAEESGLIVPIGWWVLRQACQQISLWQSRFGGNPPLLIGVNLRGQTVPVELVGIENVLQCDRPPVPSVKSGDYRAHDHGHPEPAAAMRRACGRWASRSPSRTSVRVTP